jgi:choline-phosphate cytidylyltransferase
VRVFADGIYDLFHFGHGRSLCQAKQLFANATLVVGVSSDEDTARVKGSTVETLEERVETLSHCRWVDEIIPKSPWVLTPEFVKEHRIDYVVHGEDISLDANGNDVYAWLKKEGKFITIRRTSGISTSDIVARLIRDREKYIYRNLGRKYTRQQLNISYPYFAYLKLKEQIWRIFK